MLTDDQQLLGPEHYWRFQTVLTRADDDVDDARPENITKLKAQAPALILPAPLSSTESPSVWALGPAPR